MTEWEKNGKAVTGEWEGGKAGEWEGGDGRMGRRRRENGNGDRRMGRR